MFSLLLALFLEFWDHAVHIFISSTNARPFSAYQTHKKQSSEVKNNMTSLFLSCSHTRTNFLAFFSRVLKRPAVALMFAFNPCVCFYSKLGMLEMMKST